MKNDNHIESVFNHYVETKNFSGVGLVKQGEDILYHAAHGYAHKGFLVKNRVDTKFDTASITKVFTATAMLMLVDQQLLSLHDRLEDIIDIGKGKLSKDITIYHLLTHTSGIADDADEEAGESYEAIWEEIPNYSVREATDYVAQFIDRQPNFMPGEGCRYNNAGFILLGLVIEAISGRNYRDFVKEHIFDVVEMKHTNFYAMDETVENAAEHYTSITDANKQIIGYRKNIYSYPPIGSADAGALTTASDLDQFIRHLSTGKLLSESLTQEMLTPKELYRKHEQVTEWKGYGLEFLILNTTNDLVYMQKDGINAGVSCIMKYYPDKDITIIILANQDTDVWDLAWDIQDHVVGEVL
ncbi:serine hydrolase domain-containing protein [Virgibacillus pantothenticus]|uniref:serine hydrolase domain-containing protein n=1 Tax=Virgibacillus pantothenticus TaxID=1473 RepID=UPI000987D5C0|nr:serine hydrolase domain-containing protein [Virgibacillus pantothenticus]